MNHQPDAKRDALAATRLFRALTPRQLDEIARVSDERQVPAGGTLCDEGDFGLDTFVIADGQVSVVIDDHEVAVRGPGEVVGDWAMFGSGFRSATLRALTNAYVVVVDPREMDSLMAAVPATARALGPGAAA